MKRKIFSILFALVLVCSLGLVTAVPAGANTFAQTISVTEVASGAKWGGHSAGALVKVADGRVVWKDFGEDIHIANLDGSNASLISPASTKNFHPSTSNGKATWYGKPTGESYYQIFYYDGSSTIQLTSATSNQMVPRLEGNYLIYVADAGGGGLYLWDINTSSEGDLPGTQITANTIFDHSHHISDGKVIFNEVPGYGTYPYDVYIKLYDIGTPTTTTIATFALISPADFINPITAISGDYVAYETKVDGIHLYKMSDGMDIKIADSGAPSDIGHGKVTWCRSAEIFVYDIASGATTQITDNEVIDSDPRLGGGFVAWVEKDGAGPGEAYKLKAYAFDTGTTYLLANDDGTGTSMASASMIPGSDGPYVGWIAHTSYSPEDTCVFTARIPQTFYVGAGEFIQNAITAAEAGDTINVAAGEYDEAVTIDKQLTLLGAQNGVDPTVDEARTDTSAESIINTQVGSQHIQGSVDIKADGVTVDGFTVTGAPAHAILVHNDKSGNTITNNIISNNVGWGVQIGTGLNHNAVSNTVTNNVISHNGYDGIHLWDADYNTITGNVISYSGRCGIYLTWSDDNTVEDNDISYSGQQGLEEWLSGISLDHGFRNTLTGNTLSNNQERGICMWDSEENMLTHNTISNNKYGIYLRLKPTGNIDNEAHYNNIIDNTYGVYNCEIETFDATNNWWGTAIESQIAELVSGNVDYSPWLPAPFDQIEEGAIDSALVSGSDPGPKDLRDDDNKTIAIVNISDALSSASGTIIASRYIGEPTEPTTSLSVGTDATGVVFLDVKVTGYTEGMATITVPYTDNDVTGVEEKTLGLYYWDEWDEAGMWRLAKNSAVNTSAKTVSGGIPVSALTGTPIGLGGYEALVAIESILNLSISGEDTVELTIKTNTASLGAATIDLMFDPSVVKVLGVVEDAVNGENSAFENLKVNLNYMVIGNDLQVARFLAYQTGADGVDATEDAVVAVVKLEAVGSTMDFSSLRLEIITLKDNNLDRIPRTVGAPSFALVGGVGDANRDTYVDTDDLVEITFAILGFSGYSIDPRTMNVDGKDYVDAADCTYLARHLVGLTDDYPLPPLGWKSPWGPWPPAPPKAP